MIILYYIAYRGFVQTLLHYSMEYIAPLNLIICYCLENGILININEILQESESNLEADDSWLEVIRLTKMIPIKSYKTFILPQQNLPTAAIKHKMTFKT
jgi:hypothetical protein